MLTNFRDPSGLVDRAPELAALAERAPALRRAIERGLPHEAYRALYWAHKRGRFGDLARTAAELLAHRRLFLKPLTGAPSMFTYNGIGTSLYGNSDADANDGTYVATLFFVLVFVPVFPIASYLVRDASHGGRRAWSFIAKVPLGTFTYLWQRAGGLAMLGLVAFGAISAVEGYGHQTVHVANALGAPVMVTVSGSSAKEIASGTQIELRTTVGVHTIAITLDGRTVEESSLDVPRGSDKVVVWNILGAAPINAREIHYGDEHASSPSDSERPDVLCGQRAITRADVDYVFTTPPKSISVSSHSGHETIKKGIFLADTDWKGCVTYLESIPAKREDAARIVMDVMRARQLPAASFDDGLQGTVIAFAPQAEAEAFAKDLLARDSSATAHRFYQTVLKRGGQTARLIAEYDARRDARPDDPDALYLAIRLHPSEREREEVDAALARFPKHAFLLRASTYAHSKMREFEPVVAASETLRGVDEALWIDGLDRHVEALAGLGRTDEALSLADGVARDKAKDSKTRVHAAFLARRVAYHTRKTYQGPEDDDAADTSDRDAADVFRRAYFGEPVADETIGRLKNEDLREAMRITRDARTEPDAALARVKAASLEALQSVPPSVVLVLFGEAARRGVGDTVEKLAKARGLDATAADEIRAYVTRGALSESVADLPLELRAAIEVARSRATGLSAKERQAIVTTAKASDVFAGPVTVALEGWTP